MPSGLLAWEQSLYPVLQLKAWNGRLFCIFFSVLLGGILRSGEVTDELLFEEAKLVRVMCQLLEKFFSLSEQAPRFLSEAQAQEMNDAVLAFLRTYETLAKYGLQCGRRRFKIVPKFHVFKHIGEDVLRTRYNYRYYHCFLDEDYIGAWKTLATRTSKELMEFRLITRYLLRLRAS